MERHGYSLGQRFLAMLLCAMMLVPTALVPVSATEVTEPTAVVETTVPAQEWVLPDCDCGSPETELGKHGETCARKVFLEEFCAETAADIFAKWEDLPEECRNYILECLSKDEADAEKLAELKGYVDAAQKEPEQTEEATKETEASSIETEESNSPALYLAQETGNENPLAVVWSGSDFQYGTGDTIEEKAANNKVLLQEIITAQKNAGYRSIDEALFPGDLTPSSGKEASNIGAATVLETLNENWGLTADKVMFATGNHDSGGFDLNDATGGYDREHYAVYNINYAGFPCKGSKSVVQDTANALKKWLDAKAETGYAKPIFVMTHLPLHHNGRYDNYNASYIVDVLNEAGEKGLNIIFLFGHNHSGGYDRYVGGSCIYYAPGDTMLVSKVDGTVSGFTETTLHFTYMNAGYVGYAATGESGSTLSSCIFEIYEDRVEITRFNKSGTTNLKNAGAHSSSYDAKDTDGNYLWDADTAVTSSSQILNLSDIVLSVDTANTTLGETLEKGKSASVAITVGQAEEYDVTWESFNPNIATVSGDGSSATITAVANGVTTIQARVSAVTSAKTAGVPATIQFDVVVAADDAVQINGGEPLVLFAPIDNLYNAFDLSAKYMILNTNQPGSAKAFGGADSAGSRDGDPINFVKNVDIFQFAPAGEGPFTISTDGYDIWKFEENSTYPAADYGYALRLVNANYYIGLDKTLRPDSGGNDYKCNIRITSSFNGSSYTATFDVVNNASTPLATKKAIDGTKDPKIVSDIPGYTLNYNSSGNYFQLTESGDPVYFFKEAATINDGWMWVEGEGSIVVDGSGALGATLYIMIDDVVHTVPITTDMVSGVYWSIPGTYEATVSYLGTEVTNSFLVKVTNEDGSVVDAVEILVNNGDLYKFTRKVTSTVTAGMQFIFADNYNANYSDKGNNPEITLGLGNAIGVDQNQVVSFGVNVEEFVVSGESGYYIRNADPHYVWVVEGTGRAAYLKNLATGEYLSIGDAIDTSTYDMVVGTDKPHSWYVSSDNSTMIRSNPVEDTIPNAFCFYDDGNGSFQAKPYQTANYQRIRTWYYEKDETLDRIIAYVDRNSGTLEAGQVGLLAPGGNIVISTYLQDGSYTTEQIPITVDMMNVTVADLLTSGEHTCTVSYAGTVVTDDYKLIVTGTPKDFNILSDSQAAYLTDTSASVVAGSVGSVWTQDEIVMYSILEDGTATEERIPVTINMLNATSAQLNNVGSYSGLTVTYDNMVISNNYTLDVYAAKVDDYPEFPDEGAVKIDKWADTSIYDYFGTGTAQVNLSVTGIPSRNKANMVFILDASSSMRICVHGGRADSADKWTDAERASFKSFLLDDITRELTDEEKDLFQRLYDAQSSVDERYQTAFDTRLAAGESYGSEYVTHLKKWLDLTGYCSVSGEWAGMDSHECPTREKILEDALIKMLADFAAADENGYVPDVDIAIAYFNSYTQLDNNYLIKDSGSHFGVIPTDGGEVFLDFTNSTEINETILTSIRENYKTTSGTNYDDAMQQAYDLLKAKQYRDYQDYLAEGTDAPYEPRQDFVIFMSDGQPYQFNYFGGSTGNWSNWYDGNLDEALAEGQTYADAGFVEEAYLDVFEAYYHPDGKMWMAEAIKGDETQKYKIIDPNANTDMHIDYVNGLGATLLTIGFNLGADGGSHEVMKRIATSDGHYTACETAEDIEAAFGAFSTMVRSANNAVFKDQMGAEFNLQMVTNMTTGEDQMVTLDPGPVIQVKCYETWKHADEGNAYTKPDGTVGTVTEKMVGTRKSQNAQILETIMFNENGTAAYSTCVDKDGDGVPGAVLNTGGTCTITDPDDNILSNDVICAANFWYNTSLSSAREIVANGLKVNLETETFYWNVGAITEDELVLSYFVYLTGSIQGDRNEAGRYDTNEYATLTYTNYLGHSCKQSVPTPVLPWNQATVGYGFYLVNEEGKPIINQTTGKTGSFEQAVRITAPVYETFALNSAAANIVANIVAAEKLPDGYTLFDQDTTYKAQLGSDGSGYYEIIISANNPTGKKVESTYVLGIENTPVHEEGHKDITGYQIANTVVWFAVYAQVTTVPDTVVIDYGLPVEIDVLANDTMMGANGELTFVGGVEYFDNGLAEYKAKEGNANKKLWQYLQTLVTENPQINTTSVDGKYGVANVNETIGKICYTLNESNGMQMKEEETFVYAVNYTGSVGTQGYYYSTVTVVPATTIYYEDSFVKCSVFNMNGDVIANEWDSDGSTKTDDQAQDRPGEYSLPEVDANNIYGYDGAYTDMTTYSMGSAKMAVANTNQFAEAQFTFNGTGFDVVSLTSNTSGTVTVSVYKTSEFVNADGTNNYGATPVETHMVDTYYGYSYELCDVIYEWDVTPENPTGHWVRVSAEKAAADAKPQEPQRPAAPQDGDRVMGVEMAWIVDTDVENALYQIPVMKVNGLEYGQYTALITVWYEESLDHQNYGQYEFYLDAIRIYDPANDGKDNQVIEDAYVADGEGWPEYFELRNLIINRETFDSLGDETVSGIVFIDNTQDNETGYSIEDYTNFGPNNELYLAPCQSIAFNLSVTDPALANIHLAMKSVGGTAYVKYYDSGSTTAADMAPKKIATATDLYYDITSLNGKTVVITNAGESGDAILSITNVKVTYNSAHTDSIESSYFKTTQEGTKLAVASLMMRRPPVAPEEPDVPETTVPEETVPETTVPETTVPEETIPETTVPEEPEESVFEPKKFSVHLSDSNVKVGSDVFVTVYTGRDVEYITINGAKVTRYSGSRYSSTRTWQVRVAAEAVGELEIAVVCYNSEDLASKAVVKNVNVTEEYTEVIDIIRDLIIGFIRSFW